MHQLFSVKISNRIPVHDVYKLFSAKWTGSHANAFIIRKSYAEWDATFCKGINNTVLYLTILRNVQYKRDPDSNGHHDVFDYINDYDDHYDQNDEHYDEHFDPDEFEDDFGDLGFYGTMV